MPDSADGHDYSSTGNVSGDPTFGHHFNVEWGTVAIPDVFEVSGIGSDTEQVRFGAGENAAGSVLVHPGQRKIRPITIKRYIKVGTPPPLALIWSDVAAAATGQVTRNTLAVQFLDDTGNKVAVEFDFLEAWVSEYKGPTFAHDASEPATEEATFQCEVVRVVKA
jgi:phage tail-like protein